MRVCVKNTRKSHMRMILLGSTFQRGVVHYFVKHPARTSRKRRERHSCVRKFGMSIGRNFASPLVPRSSPAHELDSEKLGYIHGHVCNILQPRARVQTYITVFRRGTFRNSSRAAGNMYTQGRRT